MATEEKVNHITAVAGADLSAALYKFGVYDSAGAIVVNSTAQGPVDGVIDENVASGSTFPLAVADGCIKKVMLGATLSTKGALVASDASGRAIAYVEAAGNVAVGKLIDTGVSGDICRIHFIHKKTGGGT